MYDGERELALCQVFAEAFIDHVLIRLQIEEIVTDLEVKSEFIHKWSEVYIPEHKLVRLQKLQSLSLGSRAE